MTTTTRLAAGLILLALAACRREAAGPIHFAREEIDITVRPGAVEVLGTYHFTCSAEETVAAIISYPFPLDSVHGYPDSVVLPGRRFELADSAARFVMRFPPRGEASFTAWYRQPLSGSEARYIVTSTRQWRRPIDRAQFRVTVPADLPGATLNYRPDSTRRTDSTLTWFFTRLRFYPSEDVIVRWSDRAR
ncbi:MAG TPA: hypothetical protein ENN51_08505 [candidate division WOR-3 bacterium]|uniref:DUF4424 domain-containing protein n=1 Tax=candidate division WOR-3 bacterium TaxID=2052148 RepID=A0A7V0T6X7_UNCW3|nr:hypothetical protein [candidate division WOR-3 bacterium]